MLNLNNLMMMISHQIPQVNPWQAHLQNKKRPIKMQADLQAPLKFEFKKDGNPPLIQIKTVESVKMMNLMLARIKDEDIVQVLLNDPVEVVQDDH